VVDGWADHNPDRAEQIEQLLFEPPPPSLPSPSGGTLAFPTMRVLDRRAGGDRLEPPLWTAGASPWAHEREALAFVQTRLPNHEPYRAWNNVEFIAEDGSVNEVDLIVVTPHGFLLVEIKSWPGAVTGDGQKWKLRRPNGNQVLIDHPLLLANRKAKRLRSLLARQSPFRHDQPPWVTPLIFLSSPDLTCHLNEIGRASVCGRDGESPLPGIVQTLKDPSVAGLRGAAINKPISLRLAEALDQAGLKPSNRGRRVGDWELNELLDEGPGWQDFAATRPRIGATRRVRIYLAGAATTAEEEERLRREADREFRVVHDLRHEGVAQPLDLVQAERGPALLFERQPDEERLDLWAPTGVAALDFGERIELVRQVAEAIAHAHSRKVTHRALTARSVLVRPPSGPHGAPRLVVGHWQAGARDLATRLTSHSDDGGTSLGSALIDRLADAEQVYLAPEAFSAEEPDGAALDVFSLGALAFLLLSGQPPAADLVEREGILAAHSGFALERAVDSAPDDLLALVLTATDPVPARRGTVRDVLDMLDSALEAITAPPPDDPGPDPDRDGATDPLTAHQGTRLEGGWEVVRRLGSGSTAVAFLCNRTGSPEPEVLKVAKDEDHAGRLLDEARALESLRHPGIVKLLGVERIGGRTTLRLAPAGDPDNKAGMTLADRLDALGRVELDLLERWGTDLLDVVDLLEHDGIPHRDIKPDNLGVRPRPGDKSLHLVLFDFSLARTPDSNLGAGTTGYLDPFLAERPSRRWDPAAERYAAAVTLFEMGTGTRPVWGDGRTDPVHLSDEEPRIEASLFDPAVRDGLVAYFARALHRRPEARFENADAMRLAWRAVFVTAARPVTATGDDQPADAQRLAQLAEAASPSTPLAELGLSGAATSALERLGLGTVGQLLDYSSADWNRATGVGNQIRREVQQVVERLRDRTDLDPGEGDPAASIDRLAARLAPVAGPDRDGILLLLGLQDQLPLTAPGGAPATEPPGAAPAPATAAWPTLADLSARLGLDRGAYDALLERARARWLKEPAVTRVRNELHAIVQRAGGALAGDELALALAAHRGSTATGPDRLRRARAVVRASLEAEARREGNRFTWRRAGGGASAVVAVRTDALDGEVLADFVASLGREADLLAAADPLLGPAAVIERLRRVAPPAGLAPLPDHRLVRLAAASSATAAVSSRLEVYPKDLSPERAVVLARTALMGPGALTEEDVRNRVRTRFPDAQALPGRPELDELLKAKVGLEWAPAGQRADGAPRAAGFGVPDSRPAAPTSLTSIGGRRRTGTSADVPDEERELAENVDERLRRHAARGGYLVLTVATRRQEAAIGELARLGAAPVSVDEVLIGSLRAHAAARNIRWDQAILAADAEGPGGEHWKRLLTVVRDAVGPVREQLLTGGEHVVITHPGLLARYDLLGLLDELRERTNRQPDPGQTLRTVWVLVPTDDPDGPVSVAGKAVPVLPPERLALPTAWLDNVHRTTATAGARP